MVTVDYEKIHFMAHRLAKRDAEDFLKLTKFAGKLDESSEKAYKSFMKDRVDFHIQKMMELKSNKEQK